MPRNKNLALKKSGQYIHDKNKNKNEEKPNKM
jgi:hypothetical protein